MPYQFTKEDSRRGGIASGEARRKKRTLRETAEILLQSELPSEVRAELATKGFEAETVMEAMVAGVIERAIKGNSQAFASIMKLLGEDSHKIEINSYDDSAERLEEWCRQARERYKKEHEEGNTN